jgi:hypothetical protein
MDTFELHGTTWPLRIASCKFPGELDLQLHIDGDWGIPVVPLSVHEEVIAERDKLQKSVEALCGRGPY